MSTRNLLSAVLALLIGLVGHAAAQQGWGTIKGKVVIDGEAPKPEKATIDKDQAHCLSKGPIYRDNVVVNQKNKGVRWVLVWLADPKDGNNAKFVPPIHPSLKDFVTKKVEIDQPCCVFEPRVMGVMQGQTLVVKNSAPIPHNFKIDSIGGGPVENPLTPPKGSVEISKFVPKVIPTVYSCSIHAWMKGYIGTFAHPYFTVTNADGEFEIKNAPAGKIRLMTWQEQVGFVVRDAKNPRNRGQIVEVKAGGTTDIGTIKLTLPKE